MAFKDVVAVIEQELGTELAVVQDTTVFEVAGGNGGPRVRILVQDEAERNLVLLSADLGEPPPEGRERLFRTMLEANNLFEGTVGATLALDAATGRFRLQRYESPDEFSNDIKAIVESFIETALFWSRAIADFRPTGEEPEAPSGDFHMMHV